MTPTTLKFKSLLGAEATDGWLNFMDEVHAELPFLFESGRPTKEQIADSEIGRAGHKSWSDYVESELSWNMSAWRAWMRSYKVVLSHNYLRDLELSSNAINTLSRKSDEFPETVEAFTGLRQEIERDQKARQEKSLTEAKRVNDLLRAELEDSQRANTDLSAEIDRLKHKIEVFHALPWYKKIFFNFA